MRNPILRKALLAAALVVLVFHRPSRADQSPSVCWMCYDWGFGYEECTLWESYFYDCTHHNGKCWVSGPGCFVRIN